MKQTNPQAAPAAATPSEPGANALMDRFTGIDWLQLLETWSLKLLAAVVIFLVGRWLAKRLTIGLGRVLARARVDSTLIGFLRNISYAVMLVLVVVTALSAVGVPTTSMFAILGAAGLAVGLALKDSLSNIASGVMLIILRPFRVGDHVVLAGQEGVVDEVRVFQTTMHAFDQRTIVLPNSEVTSAPIVNYSTRPNRRAEVAVGVGYEDDLKKAQELLLEVARSDPSVLDSPAPFVNVKNLGESSVDLILYAYMRNADYTDTLSRLIEATHDRLIANGISIPYPQRDLHVYHHAGNGGAASDAIIRAAVDDGDRPNTAAPR